MKIRKQEGGSEERLVLTGMITDTAVLARVSTEWREAGLFSSEYSNILGGLCVDYWARYQKPPGRDIEDLFKSWAEEKTRNEDLVEIIEDFLSSLSEEYEQEGSRNSEFILDVAGKTFSSVSALKLAEGVKGDIQRGEITSALDRISSFGAPEMGSGSDIDIFNDEEALRAAFDAKSESLIEWPGAMGTFLNASFTRDSFISLMGPEKRGKTWWLVEIAWQAVRQKKRVAFFEIGDMSQNQIMRRFATRMVARPLKAGVYKKPVSFRRDDDKTLQVDFEEKEYDDEVTWRPVAQASERLRKGRKGSFFKLSTHPNSSISASGISAIVNRWARRDWVPDVIVIDYADLLEPMSSSDEGREQINKTWKYLRRLSQEFHCCVVTATQSDSASYNVHTLTKANFSDDKRKLAHVTGMLGLNMTQEEKEKGIYRLNWIVNREEEWTEYQCVNIAGSLAYGRPAIISCFEET